MTPTTKVKVENFSFIVKKSCNKTVININVSRHEDFIYPRLSGLGEYYVFG